MKRLSIILFLIAIVALACILPRTSAMGKERFTIFQTTDLHGHIGDRKFPGLTQIAYELRKQRKGMESKALWIDCGDLTLGTLAATFDNGASMIDGLNVAGCDIFVPGNHDFDYGREVLISNLKAFQGTVLGANLKIQGCDTVRPWTLVERDEIKIAVLGIIPPYLKLWMGSELLDGIEVTDAESAITRYMPEIIKAKPNVIVLAIHLGEYTGTRLTEDGKTFSLATLASKYPQIDLILCGHSHQTEPGKRLYSGAWLVQAPAEGKSAARIDIELKPGERTVDSISSRLFDITEESPRDTELQKLFEPIQKQENALAPQEIARIDFDLKPMRNSKTRCRLAEELCEAMRESTGADAAFSTTISNYTKQAGSINERNLFDLIPYRNLVITKKITTEQLRTIIHELEEKHANMGTWMTWTGIKLPEGVDGPVILTKDGHELQTGEQTTVAFSSYSASGAGGRYPELAKITSVTQNFHDNTPDLREVFRTYLKKHYPIK